MHHTKSCADADWMYRNLCKFFKIHRNFDNGASANNNQFVDNIAADNDDPGLSDFEDEDLKRSRGFVASAKGESRLAVKRRETSVPVVSPEMVSDVQFIIDSGADFDLSLIHI